MSTFNVDLTNCDREPIHIPGKVQSHGFLVAVNSATFAVTYVSENISNFLNTTANTLLGAKISTLDELLIDEQQDLDLISLLKLGLSQGDFEIINPYKLHIGEDPFYLVIHKSGENLVLEFEQATLQYDIQSLIGKSVSEILSHKNIQGLLEETAKVVKNIIDYDRIMIYKFEEDGHGEVVAEVKEEELEPFFGLHYPASDIPKQARELYKLNYTRIIASVIEESAPILTFNDEQPLDLTHSTLRAVSPIHIQYLKNMGVASSFSISLMAKGELWGLIACHNYSPKFIDYKAREGSKLIGQILSSALEHRQDEESSEKDNSIRDSISELFTQLEKDSDLVTALTVHKKTLLDAADCTGVAISFENHTYTLGEVPGENELDQLFHWLKMTMQDSVYHTNQLPEVFRPAENYAKIASGLLACMLSKDMGELIVWFKPEKLKTVNWAGNPDKPVEHTTDGLAKISPRNSFETWAEIVKNTSNKWTQFELSAVQKLREKILSTIHKKANEIRVLNERLKIAYEELDTFSYTISHDLRTPLTSIKSYTEMFLNKHKDLDENGKKLLDRVLGGADKMGYLINEILKLARVGRAEINYTKIDMDRIISETSTEVAIAHKMEQSKIEIGECPPIYGDEVLIGQVFSNLIGNAVKYSAKAEKQSVGIQGSIQGNEVIYSISDNGIGIDANYHDRVFELFKRMDNVKDFDGTGVGLAIVKRIIERHNARIWFESELEKGTTFFIAFKK